MLKFRLRSEQEIYQRLKVKKFDEPVIRDTLSFLKEKQFIDDNLFAETWITSRLKKPLGFRKIKQELKLKGISQDIVDGQIEQVAKDYSESEEVLKLAEKKIAGLKNIEPEKAKKRVYSYLLRRGFSPEIIIDTLNSLCKPTY